MKPQICMAKISGKIVSAHSQAFDMNFTAHVHAYYHHRIQQMPATASEMRKSVITSISSDQWNELY